MAYTAEELKAGIVAADAAGDTESVQKLGAEYRRMQTEDAGKHTSEEYAPPPAKKKSYVEKLETVGSVLTSLAKGVPKALSESALSQVSGVGYSIGAGLAGLAETGSNLVEGQSLDEAIQGPAQKIKGALADSYQPGSSEGQMVNKVVSAPMEMASSGASKVGGAIGEAINGPQGRVAGEAIGEATPPIAAALMGGKQALDSTKAAAIRQPAPVPGKDFDPLRQLSPGESMRLSRQQKQGIQPTLGSVTRDPEQMRFEDQTGKTQAGAELRQRELENNAAIIKHIQDADTLRAGRPAAENSNEVGLQLGQVLEEKKNLSMEGVSALYEKARAAGETKMPVKPTNLEKVLSDNAAEHPSLDVIQRKLSRLKELNGGQVTVDDMELIYKTASNQTEFGTPSSVYMGKVKKAINADTEGAGGDLYRAARAARLAHGMEFEERRAIAEQVNKTTKTDYKLDIEQRYHKAVYGSSRVELNDIMNSLLTTDPKTPLGKKAFQTVREVQSQVIDDLIEAATKGVATDEKGNATFSPAGFRQGLRKIGRDKLDDLLGPHVVEDLYATLQSAQELKTTPGRVAGSDTALNLRTEAARVAKESAINALLDRVPIAKHLAPWWRKRQEAAKLTGQINEVLTPTRAAPEDIAQQASAANRLERKYKMGEARRTAIAGAPAAYAGATTADKENAQ